MATFEINVDGAHGRHGSPGQSNHATEGRGGPGEDGEHGKHAGDIKITLTPSEGRASVTGTKNGLLNFGDGNKLRLSAKGGNGGHGGKGGKGGPGVDGSDGADATQTRRGGDGGDGGRGGRGGPGGRGGNAGNGGHIRVTTADQDMDLHMFLEEVPKCHAGTIGKGGAGGDGGDGGRGGRGGNACYWTETTTYRDSYGNVRTDTQTHSMPGGYPGSDGPQGYTGTKGDDGNPGKDGSFKEVVTWANGSRTEHEWRYMAQVINHHFVDVTTHDGIFEPDEFCEVTYRIKNIGKMPTPLIQYILTNIYPTKWIERPQGTKVSDRLVPVGSSTGIERPIGFHLADTVEPEPNTRFTATTNARWDVSVERVCKHFTDAELGPPHQLLLQFPVKISRLHGAAVIARSEEAPLVFDLHNLCTRALGGREGRVLRVHAALVRDNKTMLPMTDGSQAIMLNDMGNPIPFVDIPVESLQRQGNLLPGCMIRFGSMAKDYEKVVIGTELFLGRVHDMANERRIQRMSIDLQLAEYYKPPTAEEGQRDVVIATSHSTSREAYLAWHALANHHNLTSNTWNVTMHDGISLTQTVNGSRLVDDCADRTIIIENNTPAFLTTVRHHEHEAKMHAADTIPARDVCVAMRDRHVNFVAIGVAPNLRTAALPLDGARTAIPTAESPFTYRGNAFWVKRIQTGIAYPAGVEPPTHDELLRRHKDLTPRFGATPAWHVMYGGAAARYGEVPEEIQSGPVRDLVDRVNGVLDAYWPGLSDACRQQLIKLVKQKGVTRDDVTDMLYRVCNGAEFVWEGNEYEYVRSVVFTKSLTVPKAKLILSRAAKEFHKEIEKLKPQWKFVVQYELAPHFSIRQDAIQGEFVLGGAKVPIATAPHDVQRLLIGRLTVHRSADRNDIGAYSASMPPALHGNAPIGADAVYQCGLPMIKGLPFWRKMYRICDPAFHDMRDNSPNIASAVLSDLTTEQAALRRAQWTGPVSDRTLLDHCPRLCLFAARVYDTVRGGREGAPPRVISGLLNVAAHLRALLNRWIRWHDHFMFNRRWRALNGATRPIVDDCLGLLATINAPQVKEVRTVAEKMLAAGTLEEAIAACEAGLFSQTKVLCGGNVELIRQVTLAESAERANRAQKDGEVVVSRWEVRSPGDRRLMLHKIRGDFNAEGNVAETRNESEKEQNQRTLKCPLGMRVRENTSGDANFGCAACENRVEGKRPYDCRATGCNCQYVVCGDCYTRATTTKWSAHHAVGSPNP